MAEGRAAQDPADEATPQPSQQAAAGSAPRDPPTQAGDPEDAGTSIPSVVATIVHALLGPAVGELFLRSMERALDTSQQWLNRYLPLGERQAADEAAEGPDSASAGALWPSRLLGSFSGVAGSRAAALVQQLRQKWLDAPHHLAQLLHFLDMTEAVQQDTEEPLHNGQERWACRHQARAEPCPHPACPGAQARPLAVGRMLARRLQDALAQLRARVGQLPAPLQQAARRAQRGVAKLHGTFSQAGSLRELLGTVVAQGCEVVAQGCEVVVQGCEVVTQAWEALVMFLLQHPTVPRLEDAAEATGTAAPGTAPPHPQT